MKKILFFLLLALVAVLLAVPWFVGAFTERQIEQQLSLGAESETGVAVVTDEYRRRWFSADSRHRLVITDPDLVAALREFNGGATFGDQPAVIVDTRIDHGPLPFTSLEREGGSLAPALSRARSVFSLDLGNGAEPLPLPGELLAAMAMDGSTDARFTLERGETEFADGSRLSWEGASIDAKVSADVSRIESEGTIRAIDISGVDGTGARIAGMEFRTEQRYAGHGFYVGPVSVDIGAVDVLTGAEPVRVGAFRVRGDSDIVGDLLEGDATFSIRDIGAGANQVSVEGELAMANLHAPSLQALSLVAEQLEASGIEPEFGEFYSRVEGDVARLVAAGPTIDIRSLVVETPEGQLRLRAYVAVAAGDSGGTLDPRDLTQRLTASADLSMPSGIVRMLESANPDTGAQIQMLIQMGILREEGDGYRLEAQYGDGILTVNGFPLPVPIGL